MRRLREPLMMSGNCALLGGHGVDDGDQLAHLLVVDLSFTCSGTWPMPGSLSIRLAMPPMLVICSICSRKSARSKPLPFLSFLASFSAFSAVDLALDLLDQGEHVAHAQDAGGDPVGMEGLQRRGLLADPEELDRLAGDVADRQRRAAAGVAVGLGEDDAGQRQGVVERLGGVGGVLAGHGCPPRTGSRSGLIAAWISLISSIIPRRCADGPAVSTISTSLNCLRARVEAPRGRWPPGSGRRCSGRTRPRPRAARVRNCSMAAGR